MFSICIQRPGKYEKSLAKGKILRTGSIYPETKEWAYHTGKNSNSQSSETSYKSSKSHLPAGLNP